MLNVWFSCEVLTVKCQVWLIVVPFSNVPFGYADSRSGYVPLMIIVVFIGADLALQVRDGCLLHTLCGTAF